MPVDSYHGAGSMLVDWLDEGQQKQLTYLKNDIGQQQRVSMIEKVHCVLQVHIYITHTLLYMECLFL